MLCEKPITTTLSEAQAIMLAAKEYGRVFYPCHNYKYAPIVQAINKKLAEGVIGDLQAIHISTFRNDHAKGKEEDQQHWRRDRAMSGDGITVDHGYHALYLSFDWFSNYPTAVTAKTFSKNTNSYNTEDTSSCILTFPTGYLHCYWTWNAGTRNSSFILQGNKGTIKTEDNILEIITLNKNTNQNQIERFNVESH